MAGEKNTSRRRFLLGGLGLGVAGVGALVLGWGVLPPRQRLNGSAPLAVPACAVPVTVGATAKVAGKVQDTAVVAEAVRLWVQISVPSAKRTKAPLLLEPR